MKLTDQRILVALRQGKRIRLPEFTSNDEFFLAKNRFTITTTGRRPRRVFYPKRPCRV